MSLVPAFELGLWNAWILKLLGILVVPVTGSLINKEAMEKFGATPSVPHSRIEEISGRFITLLALPFIVYSVFLPIELGTLWFYIGIPICLLALVIGSASVVSFTSTPLDKLVTKGTYQISRNPVCLAGFLLDLGIGIACASWIYLLYAMVNLILMHVSLGAEERFLVEKYGNPYREYMNRTPKWIGIPRWGKK